MDGADERKRSRPGRSPFLGRVSLWGLGVAFAILTLAFFLAYTLEPWLNAAFNGDNAAAKDVAAAIGGGLVFGAAVASSVLLLPLVAYSAALLVWIFERELRTTDSSVPSNDSADDSTDRRVRHGLNVDVVLPHILVLLEDAQTRSFRYAQRRRDLFLHISVTLILCLFGTLVMLSIREPKHYWFWITVAGYLLILGVVLIFQSYVEHKTVRRMEDLLVDLHRFALYEALRWPLPISPQEELVTGRQLSNSLAAGFVGLGQFAYVHDADSQNLREAIQEAFDTPRFWSFKGVMSAGVRPTMKKLDEAYTDPSWTVEVELGPEPAEDLKLHQDVDIQGDPRSEVDFQLRLDSESMRVPQADQSISVTPGVSKRVKFEGLTAPDDTNASEADIWISLIQQGEALYVVKVSVENASR